MYPVQKLNPVPMHEMIERVSLQMNVKHSIAVDSLKLDRLAKNMFEVHFYNTEVNLH